MGGWYVCIVCVWYVVLCVYDVGVYMYVWCVCVLCVVHVCVVCGGHCM